MEKSINKTKKLQGLVLNIEKTSEKKKDPEGITWEKCVFEIQIVGFSKRSRIQRPPESIIGKKVKVTRWCAYDWHYKTGVMKTLDPDETNLILRKAQE